MATTSPGPSPGTVIPFVPAQHSQLIPYIAALHASSITHDHTIATFIPPLSHEKLLYWWKDRIADVSAGIHLIFMLLKHDVDHEGTTAAAVPIKGPDILGVIMLALPQSETDVSRATIDKLLIHTTYRRRGGAKTLLQTAENEALLRGKTLLTLDVEAGSPAESMYSKLGYTKAGKIPNYYSVSPSGESKDAALFYKQLPS